MYKMLLPLIALFLSNWVFAAEPLYQKVFKSNDDISSDARVVATFKEAINAKKANQVKALLEAEKKELDGSGTINDVTARDLFVIEGGKGSASEYGTEYLVGIPVSMQGTGLIETHTLYFRVNYSINMATDKETVTIQDQVDIQPIK